MKITKIIFLFFFIASSFKASAKDLATWGITGSKCSQALAFVKRFGSNGEMALSSGIQGFLTGYNSAVMLNNLQGKSREKARVINRSSLDSITNYIISQCRRRPTDSVYVVLLKYYKTLPYAKY
jgi:hypothetical protein|tara:strand:+ start:79 stop:450 length:372 start_codon:yes stop_codon:yes gene_type:complete